MMELGLMKPGSNVHVYAKLQLRLWESLSQSKVTLDKDKANHFHDTALCRSGVTEGHTGLLLQVCMGFCVL